MLDSNGPKWIALKNAEAELIDKHIPQPQAAETYYKGASKIDQHIRHRQDSLNIEKKLQTNDWSKRVNQTIFSVCVVDAYLLARGCGTLPLTSQAYFLEKLVEELIDNYYDVRTLRRSHKRSREVVDEAPVSLQIDTTCYLTNTTPSKRRKKGSLISVLKASAWSARRRPQQLFVGSGRGISRMSTRPSFGSASPEVPVSTLI